MKKTFLLMLVASGFLVQTHGDLPSKTHPSDLAVHPNGAGKSVDMAKDILNLFPQKEKNALLFLKQPKHNTFDVMNGMWVQYSRNSFNVFKVKEDGTTDQIIHNHPLPCTKYYIARVNIMTDGLIKFVLLSRDRFPDVRVRYFNVNTQKFALLSLDPFPDRRHRHFNVKTQKFSELKWLGPEREWDTDSVFPIHCDKTLVRDWRGSWYKYYNCKTGQYSQTILDSSKKRAAYKYQRLVYDHQADGSYHFLYAYVITDRKGHGYATHFKKVSQKEDGSVTILPDAMITIKGNDFEVINDDKNKIIVYTRTDKGFRIPHLLDLNSPKPVLKDILTRQEVCDLKSDVCKVKIKNNKIFWYTNFEKMDKKESDVTFLAKEITPLTKFNNIFIKQERELRHKFLTHPCIKTTDELFTKKIKQFTQAGTTQGHHLKKYGTENFLNFYKKNIGAHMWDAAKKVIGHIKYETIDIPGTSFKMPVSTIMASPHTSRFVLYYHGGPHCRNDNQIRYDHVFFTQCGYNFTEHNFRGSSGFGPKYTIDLHGKWFSHTRDDTALVINHMRKNGLKEGDFPIAYGGSFGGYAAVNAFVNNQCTRAIAINGLYDLNLECQIRALSAFEFGRLKKSREKNSLLNKIKPRKGAAMLIIAGSQDTICSPKHSEKLFEKMKKEGNSVEYFNIQGMGHSATTQEQAHLIYSIIAAWLGKLDGDQKCEKVFNTLKIHHTVVYKGHTGHPPSDSLAKDAPTPQAVLSQGF